MQRQLVESVFTSQAGVVIVAPYLKMLFSRLAFTQEDQFVDVDSQQRAVQLLGYVATGAQESLEHELVLSKILCGLPIEHAIALDHPLTTTETDLADGMLNAILQNWDKMSNSTVENLRGSFLIRDGRLEEDETDFYLQVESAGFDIILSFLPWSITPIQLPWMENTLHVNWSTQMS